MRAIGLTLALLLGLATGPSGLLAQRSLVVESAGGVVGSLAGFGLGWAAFGDHACGDDLTCVLRRAGALSATSAIGAVSGAWLAGRLGATEPSVVGGALGAVVGVAAGIGLAKVFEEAGEGRGAQMVAFSVPLGMLTGVGSRIGAALRGSPNEPSQASLEIRPPPPRFRRSRR